MNKIMTIAPIAMALALLSGTPAAATGTVECTGADGADASVFLSVGRLPVLAVLGAVIEAEGMIYATDTAANPDAEPIVFGQGFSDGDRLRADFTDPNVEEIIVGVRIERAFEDKAGAEAGILRLTGMGAWPIVCMSG